MKKGEFFALVFLLLFVTFGMYACYQQDKECEARGGVLVKGAFGFVCAAGPTR